MKLLKHKDLTSRNVEISTLIAEMIISLNDEAAVKITSLFSAHEVRIQMKIKSNIYQEFSKGFLLSNLFCDDLVLRS